MSCNIYLVKKLWVDPLENRNAYGFSVEGYVSTQEEADYLWNLDPVPKAKYPWPLKHAREFKGDSVPLYITEKLEKFKLEDVNREL